MRGDRLARGPRICAALMPGYGSAIDVYLRQFRLQRIQRLQRLARRHLVGMQRLHRFHHLLGLARRRGFGGGAGGDGEQRQIVGQRPRGLAAVLRLEFRQHRFGARDHRRRQACEFRDLDAVGAVGRARQHLVQEHDVALPFLDAHGGVEHPRQFCRERGQLMIMRGEQRAAAVGSRADARSRPRRSTGRRRWRCRGRSRRG